MDTKKIEEIKEEIIETVEKVVPEETVEKVKAATKKATAKAKSESEKATAKAKAASEKATATAKKTTATAKKSAAKTAGKLTLEETYIQFGGFEYKQSDIVAAAQEAFKAEGHRISSIKSLQLYVKPDEKTAYYVINEKFTGSVRLVDTKANN